MASKRTAFARKAEFDRCGKLMEYYVQRYNPCAEAEYGFDGPMEPNTDGLWVLHSDYADKAAAVESLSRENERMRGWIRSAGHSKACRIDYPSEGHVSIGADGKFESTITNPGQVCTCGLDSLRALLGEKNQGDKE